jgi:hypothetical protein
VTLPINQSPIPFADVNDVLRTILSGARVILGQRLLAMYVEGSLALGDFDPADSDIDFVIVTDGKLAGDTFDALRVMHARFAASASRWATEIEGSYLPLTALRHFDPRHTWFPRIQRDPGEQLRIEEHASDWVIHRYVLREYGITLVGPAPHTLIDPVDPDELRRAMIAYMRHEWWASLLADPPRLHKSGAHRYVILTMCRVLYTLEHGAVVSKPAAARWAARGPAVRWRALIERAQITPSTMQPDEINATHALIRFTIESAQRAHRLEI